MMATASSLMTVTLSYLALRGLMAAPSRNALISRIAPREMYGLAYALIGLAMDLGALAGPVLVGLVVERWGLRAGFKVQRCQEAVWQACMPDTQEDN